MVFFSDEIYLEILKFVNDKQEKDKLYGIFFKRDKYLSCKNLSEVKNYLPIKKFENINYDVEQDISSMVDINSIKCLSSNYQNNRVLDFSKFINLEELSLIMNGLRNKNVELVLPKFLKKLNINNVTNIHRIINNLNLIELILGCSSIKNLTFPILLKKLKISLYDNIEYNEVEYDFSYLINLKELTIFDCGVYNKMKFPISLYSLTVLGDVCGISNLYNLRELSMEYFSDDFEVPLHIEKLSVSFHRNQRLSLKDLTNLKVLDLVLNEDDEGLIIFPENLKKIKIYIGIDKFNSNIESLKNLIKLEVYGKNGNFFKFPYDVKIIYNFDKFSYYKGFKNL
jgi:hypothetical protein